MSTEEGAAGSDERDEGGGNAVPGDRDLRVYLQTGALVAAVLFALVAAVGFYTSARRVIDVWVARQFQPVFMAGFDLAVLLVMLAVVVGLLGRLE